MLENPSNQNPPEDADHADSVSWQERELVAALRRLANAQSQLALLKEENEAAAARVRRVEPADIAVLQQIEAELHRLRTKSKGLFGKSAARERQQQLEVNERIVLTRMGFATLEEYTAWTRRPAPEGVDPHILSFAERELRAAELAWQQIQSIELPEPRPEPVIDVDQANEQHAKDDHDVPLQRREPYTRPAAS